MSSLRDALKKAGFTEAKVEPKPEAKTEKKPEKKPELRKEEKREERRPPTHHQNNQRNDRRPPHSQHSNQRQAPAPRSFVNAEPPVKKHEHHFKTRNFCDQCQKTLPDVELYEQRGRTKWMCVLCADELMILDENRRTAQSDFSKKGMFRRQYGRTLPNRVIEAKAEESRAREQRPQANSSEERKPIRRFNDQAPRDRPAGSVERVIKKDDKN
jgi:hypothetical protein